MPNLNNSNHSSSSCDVDVMTTSDSANKNNSYSAGDQQAEQEGDPPSLLDHLVQHHLPKQATEETNRHPPRQAPRWSQPVTSSSGAPNGCNSSIPQRLPCHGGLLVAPSSQQQNLQEGRHSNSAASSAYTPAGSQPRRRSGSSYEHMEPVKRDMLLDNQEGFVAELAEYRRRKSQSNDDDDSSSSGEEEELLWDGIQQENTTTTKKV